MWSLRPRPTSKMTVLNLLSLKAFKFQKLWALRYNNFTAVMFVLGFGWMQVLLTSLFHDKKLVSKLLSVPVFILNSDQFTHTC